MASVTHNPLYSVWAPTWRRLLDVFEGSGGFLDPKRPYLIAHPREWLDHSIPVYKEVTDAQGNTTRTDVVIGYTANPNPVNPSPKLVERRKMARYENVAGTLIDQIAGALFRGKPARAFAESAPRPSDGSPHPLDAFWADCNGRGASWDAVLAQAWRVAAALGHVFGFCDVDEARQLPRVRWYSPLDVVDWLVDDEGALLAVRVLEAAPRETFAERSARPTTLVREITLDGWTLKKANGEILDEGTYDYGILPVFVLYAKRRASVPIIGQSVLGDPQLHLDLYNLISETRELLRKQTFSVLNVVIGDDGNADQAVQMMGQSSGTGNALITAQPASFITPDTENVTVYHDHMDRLQRLIYRLAVVPWDSDSRDAESAESRRIKREDLNQQLAAMADELQAVDTFVADMAYRIRFGGAWETWKQKDGLVLAWPDTFEIRPMAEVLEELTQSMGLDLGATATKALKKRAARTVLPDMTPDRYQAIDGEIDGMEVLTADERAERTARRRLEQMTGALTGGN